MQSSLTNHCCNGFDGLLGWLSLVIKVRFDRDSLVGDPGLQQTGLPLGNHLTIPDQMVVGFRQRTYTFIVMNNHTGIDFGGR